MTAIGIQHKFVDDLFKALGIDHSKVYSFDLSIKVNAIVNIVVCYYVEDKALGKVSGIIKHYELHETREEVVK